VYERPLKHKVWSERSLIYW